jgi:hypothetical protein
MGEIYLPVAMIKIPVRHNKFTVLVQDPRYFSEFLRLEVSDIFENALGQDDVESLVAEHDRGFEEVSFNQVRRSVMYGYVNTVVLYIWCEQAHQGCGTTANIEESTLFALCEPIYNSGSFYQPIVWLAEFQVLLAPEIFLIVPQCVAVAGAILRNDALAAGQVIHNLSLSARALPRCAPRLPGRAWRTTLRTGSRQAALSPH